MAGPQPPGAQRELMHFIVHNLRQGDDGLALALRRRPPRELLHAGAGRAGTVGRGCGRMRYGNRRSHKVPA